MIHVRHNHIDIRVFIYIMSILFMYRVYCNVLIYGRKMLRLKNFSYLYRYLSNLITHLNDFGHNWMLCKRLGVSHKLIDIGARVKFIMKCFENRLVWTPGDKQLFVQLVLDSSNSLYVGLRRGKRRMYLHTFWI